jgi:hypothetical protein
VKKHEITQLMTKLLRDDVPSINLDGQNQPPRPAALNTSASFVGV